MTLEHLFVHENGNISDAMVRLLALTGIQIVSQNTSENVNGSAKINEDPEALCPSVQLTISSRSLQEVAQAVQGRKDPAVSWLIGTQRERYQSQGLGYLSLTPEQKAEVVRFGLNAFQFLERRIPTHHRYNGILFLGSTLHNVRQRLRFLNTCLEENPSLDFGKVYLLTGVRPLDASIGENAESLADPDQAISVRSDWCLDPAREVPTDEGPMVQWVFDQSRSERIAKDQVVMVYAGIGEGRPRATTLTTVEEWLKLNPPDGLYLTVSSQPFNLYQQLVIERALRDNHRSGIRIEVIGAGVDEEV